MADKNVHDVFHINLLSKAPKDMMPGRTPPKPLLIIIDSEEEWEVEEILDSRMNKRCLQYLVKWKDSLTTESSWEPAINLKNALDIVKRFHEANPAAPRRLQATFFDQIEWKPLVNHTIPEKEVRAILSAKGLLV